jgi:hypothetical protein
MFPFPPCSADLLERAGVTGMKGLCVGAWALVSEVKSKSNVAERR